MAAAPQHGNISSSALPPPSRSARQAGWDLSDAAGAPISMASAIPSSAATRGRSAAPARGRSGQGLAGIKEESGGDSPKPPRRRTTSPRRTSGLPPQGSSADEASRAHEVPVPADAHDPLAEDPAVHTAADVMAADEAAAALAAEERAHQAEDAHNSRAQAAMQGSVFHVAPPSTAPA